MSFKEYASKEFVEKFITQPDWNQNDKFATDFIKNRLCYTSLTETELIDINAVLAENGSDWDVESAETDDGTITIYGAMLPALELEGAKTYSILIDEKKFIGTALASNFNERNIIILGDFQAYISQNWNELNYLITISPDSNEAVFVCKCSEPPTICKIYEYEQEITKLDPKYLPKGGVGYTETAGKEETHDILQIMADAGVEFIEFEEDEFWIAELTQNQVPANFLEGIEYTVKINEAFYTSKVTDLTALGLPAVSIGDLESYMDGDWDNFKYLIMKGKDTDNSEKALIALNPATLNLTEKPVEFTITSKIVETIHQIDPKYLFQPNWNENTSSKPGFIKNKTHYDSRITVKWDGTESDIVVRDYHKVSDIIATDEMLRNSLIFTNDGWIVPLAIFLDEPDFIESEWFTESYAFFEGAAFIRKAPCLVFGNIFPETGIYFQKGDAAFVSTWQAGKLKLLDEKFISHTIARLSDSEDKTIVFNGDVEGFEHIVFPAIGTSSEFYFVHLSNDTPVREDFIGKNMIITTSDSGEDVNETTVIDEEVLDKYSMDIDVSSSEISSGKGWAVLNAFLVVTETITISDSQAGVYSLSPGIWIPIMPVEIVEGNAVSVMYISSLTYAERYLNEKVIPNTIARITDIPTSLPLAPTTELILNSSTEGSTKQFKLTVNDSGTLTVEEIIGT